MYNRQKTVGFCLMLSMANRWYGLDMSEVEKVEDILYVFSNTERQYGVSGMGSKIK